MNLSDKLSDDQILAKSHHIIKKFMHNNGPNNPLFSKIEKMFKTKVKLLVFNVYR